MGNFEDLNEEVFNKYVDKMAIIIANNDIFNLELRYKLSKSIKNWLLHEWQCGAIEDMFDYDCLRHAVDDLIEEAYRQL